REAHQGGDRPRLPDPRRARRRGGPRARRAAVSPQRRRRRADQPRDAGSAMRDPQPRLAVLASLCAALLSGCATQWGPRRAEDMINTAPPGASCLLSRAGQPIATAEPTPAIALVDPSADAVTVACRRSGFH